MVDLTEFPRKTCLLNVSIVIISEQLLLRLLMASEGKVDQSSDLAQRCQAAERELLSLKEAFLKQTQQMVRSSAKNEYLQGQV